jgi:hypothetical protein
LRCGFSIKAKQYKAYGEVNIPLSKKNFSLRLPTDVQEILDNLPAETKVHFIRKLISDAVRKEFGSK